MDNDQIIADRNTDNIKAILNDTGFNEPQVIGGLQDE